MPEPATTLPEAARVQVLQRRLDGIADEMGLVLVRSALSSNIRERRDASTALFDAEGHLLAQAAHIPVHLGSMHSSVAAVLARDVQPGDVWILNDPYEGGTHLPDITLVEAICDEAGRIVGHAASRAHHADVGGAAPGSMVARATSIDEEGIRIAPTLFEREGEQMAEAMRVVRENMRRPGDRMGDLSAQRASLVVARNRLVPLIEGMGGVAAFEGECGLLRAYAARRLGVGLERVPEGSGTARVAIELPSGVGPAWIECHATRTDDGLVFDLRGSSAQTPTAFNCPRAVTLAAAMFVVRWLVDPALPAACVVEDFVQVLTEPGTVVHAQHPAAVAAGNVEVSSLVVEAITEALARWLPAVPAAGQNTMNNVVIGSDRFSYYETIAGGQGASEQVNGPNAQHVAMTNTRNTPVESFEVDFPMRVERYALRDGSGGDGARRGGDGVVRAVRVLERCHLNLLAQHRASGPPGRAGGAPGSAGEQFVNDAPVEGTTSMELWPGDLVEVRTPGGGGHGAPDSSGG